LLRGRAWLRDHGSPRRIHGIGNRHRAGGRKLRHPALLPLLRTPLLSAHSPARMTEDRGTMAENDVAREEVTAFIKKVGAMREEIGRVIVGQRGVIDGILTCLLSGSHALLEGVPGLGKTMIVRTLAQVLGLDFSRIQFTPDLMPADIIGTVVLAEGAGGSKALEFRRGPVFSHLVLADEINRATPKTQSALLEAMQEHR